MKLLQRFDYNLASLIQAIPKPFKPFMVGISFWGEPVIVLSLGLAGYILAINGGLKDIQKALLFGGAGYGLNTILKQLLHRRRPHNLKLTTLGIKSYSFPSGHAFGAVILYGLLAYLSSISLNRPWECIVAVLLGLLIFWIGVSRVYLKTHYPSDVAAGWLLGAMTLYVIIQLAF